MTLVNPNPGGYAFGAKLPSAHVNTAWAQFPYCLDGNAGGTWAPATAININGLGLVVGGSGLTAPSITGNTTFANNITVTGSATFNGACTLGNAAADGIIFNGEGDFQNGFTVGGGGTATFQRPVVCSDTVALNGASTVTATMTYSGAGRPVYKTATLTDANVNITPVTANIYYMPNGVMSTGRIVTIDDTNCVNGDWLWVTSAETGASGLTVNGPGGSPTFHTLSSGTGDQMALFLVRVGGTWRMIGLDYFN